MFSKIRGYLFFVPLVFQILLCPQASALELDIEQDSRLPLAYVNLVVTGGAVSDPVGKSGITSFLGEMLMRGSRKHSKDQIDLLLDQWGAQLGVETRAEYLIVRGAVLSKKLPDFLTLIEELVIEPSFPEIEIKKLRSEAVSGLLAEQSNDHALSAKKFARFLFQGHPYGNPISGSIREVESIQRSDLLKHHARLFHPKRILFLGSGDVSRSLLESWAHSLSKKAPGKGELDGLNPPASLPSRRVQIVDKPDRTQTQIEVGQLGLLMSDQDYSALYLGNAAFGGGSFTSRLMQEIRVKRGWSYGASSAFRFGLQPRSWQVHLFPAEKDTASALAHTLRMIEELRQNGITVEEFRLAKQSSINSAAFINDTPKKRVENRIIEKTLGLENDFFSTFSDRLEKVTHSEVNQALKEFLKPENLTISILGTADRIRSGVAQGAGVTPESLKIVPYQED